jgi:hypothetical protein
MTLIQTTTLGSNTLNITFSSIPQTFTDLLIMSSIRTVTSAVNFDDIAITVNASDTFSRLEGNGSAASSSTGTGYTLGGMASTSRVTANTFCNSIAYITNYTSDTKKTIAVDSVIENMATASGLRMSASLIGPTDPITSLTIAAGGVNMVTHTSISLYGITKGSDGITSVT